MESKEIFMAEDFDRSLAAALKPHFQARGRFQNYYQDRIPDCLLIAIPHAHRGREGRGSAPGRVRETQNAADPEAQQPLPDGRGEAQVSTLSPVTLKIGVYRVC